jgi:CTP synthase
MEENLTDKIALFCDVEKRAVIPMVTTPILAEIPLTLEKASVGEFILERLHLEERKHPNWTPWTRIVDETRKEKPTVNIALVGKYVELHDAYISVREALKHASLALGTELSLKWILSTDLEKGASRDLLESADGVVVPGGFGSRGIEGKILAANYSRTHKVPYLGLCLGMQLMVVEFARDVLKSDRANSTEFDLSTPDPVIALMPEQQGITDMGGTMRLGLYPCVLKPGSIAGEAYKVNEVEERHRHRFEFNNAYRQRLGDAGMVFSGISPDGRLVEIAELKDHPFMLGTQFHPEFLSRPNRPHPLFVAFMRAASQKAGIPYQNPPIDFEE